MLYEYYCKKCDRTFEVLHKLCKLGDKVKCPVCGKRLKHWLSPLRFKI